MSGQYSEGGSVVQEPKSDVCLCLCRPIREFVMPRIFNSLSVSASYADRRSCPRLNGQFSYTSPPTATDALMLGRGTISSGPRLWRWQTRHSLIQPATFLLAISVEPCECRRISAWRVWKRGKQVWLAGLPIHQVCHNRQHSHVTSRATAGGERAEEPAS